MRKPGRQTGWPQPLGKAKLNHDGERRAPRLYAHFDALWECGLRRLLGSARISQKPFIPQQGNVGAPERIRTSDPQIRSLVLYPAELRVRVEGAV